MRGISEHGAVALDPGHRVRSGSPAGLDVSSVDLLCFRGVVARGLLCSVFAVVPWFSRAGHKALLHDQAESKVQRVLVEPAG